MVWAAGERNLIFYAENGRIVGRDHIWVQDAMSVTVEIFCRMGLETNLEKTKTMVCTPGFIWEEWGGARIQAAGDGGRGYILGAEEVAGKLRQVRRDVLF